MIEQVDRRPSTQETKIFQIGDLELIQGGMGVGVSNWELANAVACAGEQLKKRTLGVVSGTGAAILMASRLQKGDENTLRALRAFPFPSVAWEIVQRYERGSTTLPRKPELLIPRSNKPEALEARDRAAKEIVVANFCEVWLAKHDKNNKPHGGPIGINWLEKVQMPRLPEIYGAMLAGVDVVLMGAGIPKQVPGVLNSLAKNEEARYLIDVINDPTGHEMRFDPKNLFPGVGPLKSPKFLAIISSDTLAAYLHRTVEGVDGFVVEGPTAGGHNAPPRAKEQKLNEEGEPIYGERDKPNLDKIREFGNPFWLAGGYSGPEKLRKAQETGAKGVQMGSAFALSEESGFLPEEVKERMRRLLYNGDLRVLTSAIASPTGYPLQIAQVKETLSDPKVYGIREKRRVCTYGYLDVPRRNEEGKLEFICPAEPVEAYIAKGGIKANTVGRMCLCTGLAAAVGCARKGEPIVITFGKGDYQFIRGLMDGPGGRYSARDVVEAILSPEKYAERRAKFMYLMRVK